MQPSRTGSIDFHAKLPPMWNLALRLACCGLMLTCASSWAQSKDIHENVDPYTNLRTLVLEVPARTCPGDPSPRYHDPEVHVIFSANEGNDGTVAYYLVPELDRGNVLNVRANGTMDMLLGGIAGVLITPVGSTVITNHDYDRSYQHETIPFQISQAELADLSNTPAFQFRVNGPRQVVQRCIDAKHLRSLGEFLSTASGYGTPQPPPDPEAQHLIEKVDSSTQRKVIKLDNIETQSCPGDPALGPQDADVRLTVSANQRSDGGVWYFITADLTGGTTLNLHRGDKIQTIMDGATATFNTINGSLLTSKPDASGNPVVHETIAFHVHQPDIVSLSRAAMLEFKLTGMNQTIRRCVTGKNLYVVSRFITDTTTLYASPAADLQKP